MSRESTIIIDRKTREPFEEQIWGESWLHFLYGDTFLSKTLGNLFVHTIFRWPLFSWFAGKYYDSAFSKHDIQRFCDRYFVDLEECEIPVGGFKSFNDFFTRRVHSKMRPQSPSLLTIPADGRYTIVENINETYPFCIKDEELFLDKLLGSSSLTARFYGGTAVIARLCPLDCHRFYFPIDGKPTHPVWIPGSLFSVHPIATRTRPWILWSNRRAITLIKTDEIGTMAYIEIGATNCGSIIQNYVPYSWVKKGQEKGFFKLGGSAIVLLFEPGRVRLAPDLIELSKEKKEIYCQIGQPLGEAI